MSLLKQLTQDMKAAMKAREKERLVTLRLLISGVKGQVKDLKRDLTEQEEISFLATEAKRRQESIAAYTEADRADLAEKEQSELAIIQVYLPAQLTEDEVKDILREIIASTGASSPREMGKVMGQAMPRLKGRFPGKEVKGLVLGLLNS